MNKYLIALAQISSMTPTRLRKILKSTTPEWAWQADYTEFLDKGIDLETARKINLERKSIDPESELEKLNKLNARFIHEDNADFPAQLRDIPSSPAWLFVRGNLRANQDSLLTVVGPRKVSTYGRQVCETFATEVAKNNIGIVSGMALGVDGIAHKSCLQVEGYTIAVLGTGIDNFYPPFNKSLGQDILDAGGAIISEYGCNAEVNPRNFPLRNRIVSGLSRASLIVEAGESSGSLITAKLALEQGRDIYAVPGDIFSQTSAGTNNLIKSGQAQCVTSPNEIIADYTNITQTSLFAEEGGRMPTDQNELAVFQHIGRTPKHIDDIIKSCNLPQNIVSSTLMMLSIKGYITEVGNQRYTIK